MPEPTPIFTTEPTLEMQDGGTLKVTTPGKPTVNHINMEGLLAQERKWTGKKLRAETMLARIATQKEFIRSNEQ